MFKVMFTRDLPWFLIQKNHVGWYFHVNVSKYLQLQPMELTRCPNSPTYVCKMGRAHDLSTKHVPQLSVFQCFGFRYIQQLIIQSITCIQMQNVHMM